MCHFFGSDGSGVNVKFLHLGLYLALFLRKFSSRTTKLGP